MDASYFVEKYQMQPHPEGGFFRETYRSEEKIKKDSLPERFLGDRNFGTAIYFLLESHHFSAFHRIQSDEMWHFYYGSPLHIYVIAPSGELSLIKLGQNPENGEVFQAVVPYGSWFASEPAKPHSFSLVGCTVSPGFDFADFELASASTLGSLFPQHKTLIKRLCRQ
jgi:hypothetical protein